MKHTREHNNYDRPVVRGEKVQRESMVATPNFDGIYDPREFCDWIAHLDYYFDFYEFSDAHIVQFAKGKLKVLVIDYWTIVEKQLERTYFRPIDT